MRQIFTFLFAALLICFAFAKELKTESNKKEKMQKNLAGAFMEVDAKDVSSESKDKLARW